jgi:hypothetical protein
MQLGLKFSQHQDQDRDGSTSQSDDDPESPIASSFVSKTRNDAYLPPPEPTVVIPSSRNRGRSHEDLSTNLRSPIPLSTPIPFTTYHPSSAKSSHREGKSNHGPPLQPLIQAAREGDTSRLSSLVEEAMVKGQLATFSAVGELRDDEEMSVLDHASACGQVEVIRELVQTYGVDVNGTGPLRGLTPLHHACQAGQMQAVTFLVLVASADVGRVSLRGGLTPAETATSKRIQKFLAGQKGSALGKAGSGGTGGGSIKTQLSISTDSF